MIRLDKLVERIKARPPEAKFADVEKLLEAYGYGRRRQVGSHVIFKKVGSRPITIPVVSGRKVKRVYLEEICNLLGLDD